VQFRDNKRMSFRARRLIRHLRRSGYASVQDVTLHEIRRDVHRRHGLKAPKTPDVSGHGQRRPLTRRAKRILARLRSARMWNVKKHLIAELAREMKHGQRLADRLRQAAQRVRDRARRARDRARKIRGAVSRAQEGMIARAERRAAERAKRGPRQPGRVRQRARSLRTRTRTAVTGFRDRMRPGRSRRPRPANGWHPAPRTIPAQMTRRPPRSRALRSPRPVRAPRPARAGRTR
jgi:hypothetical protein